MKFRYRAKNKSGELQVGFVEAGNRDMASTILGGHELFILSIEEADTRRLGDRIANYFGRVKRKDLVIFTRQMATLLEARLPLTDAIKTLYEQTSHERLHDAIFEIREDIDSGLALSQALERQSAIFPGFFVSMVRSAEVTGNLERVMGFLADYLEKEAVLIQKTRSALIYPGIVIGLFVVVAFIMVTFVFPQIAPVFAQSGVELPWFTKFLIASGTFLAAWWPALVLAVVIGFVILVNYLATSEGKAFLDDLKVRLPIVRKVYLPITITRLANVSSMLLKSGVPMTQAMEIASQTIDNVLYQELLDKIAQEVREGGHLADAFSRYPKFFPPLVYQMIAVGETTGRVDELFARLATFYGREGDNLVNNLVDLLQPVLMIGIGILVGVLFASILLPLYQLTSTIQ